MTRVLQVVGKMNIGGAEQLVMNVYRNIDRSKVQFDFLTFYAQGEHGFFDEEIKSLGGKIINISPPKPFDFCGNVAAIRKVLQEQRYDAVHTHLGNNAAFALIAAKKESVPIRVAHSHNVNQRTGVMRYYDALLKKALNANLTKCAACSREAAEYRFSKKHLESDYLYVPNAVDFSAFLEETDILKKREEIGIGESQKCVLQVGNFKWQKNQAFTVDLIERCFKNDKQTLFVFAGRVEGDYAQTLKQKMKMSGLSDNIILLGQRDDIAALMPAADAMVMPSIQEGLGIVLVEAQAAGLPSVVSECIQPEADMGVGLVEHCPLEDFAAWESAVRAALNKKHPPLEDRKAYLAKSDFNLNKTVACFEQLYSLE